MSTASSSLWRAPSAHAIIAGNVFAALHASLADGAWRAFASDMKVRVEKANASSIRGGARRFR